MTLPPFQLLLDQHGASLYRFLAASLGVQEADDCFQETVLAALRAYPNLRDASNLRGWLFTIAHRKAIDAHRARARRALPVGDPPDQAIDPPPLPRPDLWESVRSLPPKQRTAVLHRYLNGLPYAQIATLMETSEAAARQNVHQGLRRLKEVCSP